MGNVYKGHQKKKRTSRRARRGIGQPKPRLSKRLLDRELQELEELLQQFKAKMRNIQINKDASTASKEGSLYEVSVEVPWVGMKGVFKSGIGKSRIELTEAIQPPKSVVLEMLNANSRWELVEIGDLNKILKRLAGA